MQPNGVSFEIRPFKFIFQHLTLTKIQGEIQNLQVELRDDRLKFAGSVENDLHLKSFRMLFLRLISKHSGIQSTIRLFD